MTSTCGRPTKTGRPCERPLQWYETACVYHASQEEHTRAVEALRSDLAIWRKT